MGSNRWERRRFCQRSLNLITRYVSIIYSTRLLPLRFHYAKIFQFFHSLFFSFSFSYFLFFSFFSFFLSVFFLNTAHFVELIGRRCADRSFKTVKFTEELTKPTVSDNTYEKKTFDVIHKLLYSIWVHNIPIFKMKSHSRSPKLKSDTSDNNIHFKLIDWELIESFFHDFNSNVSTDFYSIRTIVFPLSSLTFDRRSL